MRNKKPNGDRRRFGRRAWSTSVWALFNIMTFYICMFKGLDISWFMEFAKWTTYALTLVVTGLTVTDVLYQRSKVNGQTGGE